MFLLYFKTTADILAPRLSVVFRRLLGLGSFQACCRQADITPIPKGSHSSTVSNYVPISITLILSNRSSVWCQFVLDGLWKADMCFQRPSFPIGKVSAPVLPFCVGLTPYRVHWRGGSRPGLCRSTPSSFWKGETLRNSLQARYARWAFEGSVMSVPSVSLKSVTVRQSTPVDGCQSKPVYVVPSASGKCCGLAVVHNGAFLYAKEQAVWLCWSSLWCCGAISTSQIRVAQSLNRDLNRDSEWSPSRNETEC